MSNFQDNVELNSSSNLRLSGNQLILGATGGNKSLVFSNSAAEHHLYANPSANRTLFIPDAGGTLAYKSDVNATVAIAAGTQTATSGTVVFSDAGNVTFGMSGSLTVTATVASSLTNIRVSAGTTSNLLSAITFSDANNVSFGINASTITASINPGLTNIRVSAGTTSNLLSALTFSDSNNVSFGINASTITASVNTSLTNIRVSAGTTSNLLSAITFSNTNNVSFGLDASTLTASVNTSLTNIRVSAGTTSNLLSALTFSDSNNVSFGINASTITASVNTSLTNIRVSAGTTSNLLSAITFSDSNNVSFGINASTITASVNTSLTNIRVSAGTTSNLLSAITFSNSNGISFGINNSTLTASHNAITSQTNQQMTLFATGNTTQSSSGTANASSIIFNGAGVASVGITDGSILISVPAGGGGGGLTNINLSAGTTSQNLSNFVLSNSNNVSFGLDGSTVTATVNQMTISHWPPFPVAMATSSNDSGVTGATGGSTQITMQFNVFPFQLYNALTYSRIDMIQSYATVVGTGSASIALMLGIYTLNGGTRLDSLSTFMFRHEVSQNSVTARSHRFYWGTNSTSNSSSSDGNISSLYSGLRVIPLYVSGASLASSQYWMVFGQLNMSSGSNILPAASVQCISQFGTQIGSELGSASVTPPAPRLGVFITTTNTNVLTAPMLPATIHTSVITATATAQWKWPFVLFRATTN